MRKPRTMATPFPVDRYDEALVATGHPPHWRNPEPSGIYDFAVIGGGPAGLSAAFRAVASGAKVALVERRLLGGECVNVGCIPSKTIIRTSRLYADMRDADNLGGDTPDPLRVDFLRAMTRMRRLRARMGNNERADNLTAAGIELYFGDARFASGNAVEVAGVKLRFRKALIATGARPRLPSIPGLVEAGYLSNQNMFDLTECPKRLLVIGGGPLGCEAAQFFSRLGAKVILAQKEPMFLPGEERDAAQILSDCLARDGIEVRLNSEVVAVRVEHGKKVAELIQDDWKSTVTVDEILTGIGRSTNVEGLNLDGAGVDFDESGIKVDDFLRTRNKRIFAAGDVCLEHKYTHSADATGSIAVDNALNGARKRLSSLVIPWCTYTDPEIAHVGLYPADARAHHVPVKTFTVLMHDVARAVMDGEEEGFVKMHVREGTDRILGATIVARHAGDLIGIVSLAITSGLGLREIAKIILPYPTQAAALKSAAEACVNSLEAQDRKR